MAIARQRAELTAGIVDKAAQAGPVFAVARLAGLDASVAVTIFILLLVAVLEPLSIGLAVAASAAWMPQAAEDESAGRVVKGPAGRVKAQRRWPLSSAAKDRRRWCGPGWMDRSRSLHGCFEPCGGGRSGRGTG